LGVLVIRKRGHELDNEMAAYIASKVANITRQYNDSSLDITVIMPSSATETRLTFIVREIPMTSAMDDSPTTSIKVILNG
jgi:hypothetical protein